MLDVLTGMLVGAPSPLVAFDGPDAAGKSTIADEVATRLEAAGRSVARVSLDRFHRSAEERYARGELSPEGYVDDSFDLDAFVRDVLEPLGSGGERHIVRARFDWRSGRSAVPDVLVVPEQGCVLVDGVFLHRPELAPHWSASVLVFARSDVVLARARERDREALGGVAEVERRYRGRYLPGQALYFARDQPHRRATVCVENSDPARPLVSAEAVAEGVQRWIEIHGAG